jgi:hypothetical protein
MIALISVIPNPFTRNLLIEIEYDHGTHADCIIWMIDQKGKICRMTGVTLEKGITSVELDELDNLPPGVYYLEIKNTEGASIYSVNLVKEDQSEMVN